MVPRYYYYYCSCSSYPALCGGVDRNKAQKRGEGNPPFFTFSYKKNYFLKSQFSGLFLTMVINFDPFEEL